MRVAFFRRYSGAELRLFLKRFLRALGHSFFLLLLWWLTQWLDFTIVTEKAVTQPALFLKTRVLDPDTSSIERFLYVDVSAAKKLIPRADSTGSDVRTDRARLTRLFHALNHVPKGQYRAVLCDVSFVEHDPSDTALYGELDQLHDLVLPFGIDEQGQRLPVVFPGFREGFAAYPSSSGMFSAGDLIRYPLFNAAGEKTVPVAMYEMLQGKKLENRIGLSWDGWHPGLRSLVFYPRVASWQLNPEPDIRYVLTVDELSRSLEGADSITTGFLLGKRILLIGDYANDQHKTLLEEMPGTLVLGNVFLSLEAGDHLLHAGSLLLLLSFLFFLSWIFLYPPAPVRYLHRLTKRSFVTFLLGDLALYALLTWCFSFMLFLRTNQFFDLALLPVYFSLLDATGLLKENRV